VPNWLKLAAGVTAGGKDSPTRPWWWKLRLPVALTLLGAALAASLLAAQPWSHPQPTPLCGPGLEPQGSPYVCAGLDLASTPLRPGDTLRDLEQETASQNRAITGQFVTLVVLEDLSFGPGDTVNPQVQRHELEGALTAVSIANSSKGAAPKIKLLFANFGTNADYYQIAVSRIIEAARAQHIVAVIGIGQSLANANTAINELSAANIATIGSVVTAGNLGLKDPSGSETNPANIVTNFYRVAPTNSDEAKADVAFIKQDLLSAPYRNIMMIQDTTASDTYATDLATAFTNLIHPSVVMPYQSPVDPHKQALMVSQFDGMFSEICAVKPSLIYWAGRGTDLRDFLTAIESQGSCLPGKLPIVSGDDAANLLGQPLPAGQFGYTVYYTGLATAGEWGNSEQEPAVNYRAFADAFSGPPYRYPAGDLEDGTAMLTADAVSVAAAAIDLYTDAQGTSALTQAPPDAQAVAVLLPELYCEHTIPGVSGYIAISPALHDPIDKAMVMLKVLPDGEVDPNSIMLTWPDGKPLANYRQDTCT
jgi:hypothetical protein